MFFKSSNFFAKGTFVLLLILVLFLLSLAFASNKFISLTFLKPAFEEHLSSYNQNLDVQLEKIELAEPFFFNSKGNLNFILTDVKIINEKGVNLTSVPEISISLKSLEFLRGNIVFTRLKVGGLTANFSFSEQEGLHNEFSSNYGVNQKNIWEDILKPIFFAGNAELFEDLHIFDSHIRIDNVDTHEIFNITINEAIFIRDGDEKNGVLDFFAVKQGPKGSDEDLNLTFPNDLKCYVAFTQRKGEPYISLENSRCSLDQIVLDLNATAEFNEDVKFGGQVVTSNLNMDYLKVLWPKDLGSDFARDWISTNVSQGNFPEITTHFLAIFSSNLFSLTELSGGFIYEDLSIDYFSPMQPAENIAGRGSFSKDRFDFTIESGKLGSLDLNEGNVSLMKLDTDNEYAHVEGFANGDLDELLRIIDSEPLGAATYFGIEHEKSSGTAKTGIIFDFPLARTASMDQVVFSAEGKISNGKFVDLIEGETISDGDLDLIVDKEKLTISGTMNLFSQEWKLAGESKFSDSESPQSIYFDNLSSDNNDFSLNVLFMEKGGYQLDVRGSAFSLERLFEEEEDESKKDDMTDMIVDLKVDQLWFGKENKLVNVSGKVISRNDIWELVDLEGFSGEGDDSVRFSIEKNGSGRNFSLDAKNAGDFLRSIDLYENMQGGNLIFKGSFDDGVVDHPFLGNLIIKDYHIVNAPLLTRLASMASFTGVVDQLSGEGIKFKKFTTPVNYQSDNIKLEKGRAFGNALGYTFSGEIDLDDDSCKIEGTLVPAYSINSLFEKIPIIGDILGGGRGEGLIAANFQMNGDIEDPDVSINPLSIFTPGILRDLFQIFELPFKEKEDAIAE